jgi:hypothetical protein
MPDRTTARKAPFSGIKRDPDAAPIRTGHWAGAIEGAEGATNHTAAHSAATAAPATNRRRQAAVSSIAQL